LKSELPGWDIPTNWNDTGGNVWNFSYGFRDRLWIDGVEYMRAENIIDLNDTYKWYFEEGAGIYLYSINNPATYSNMETSYIGSQSYNGVFIDNKDYVNIQNLDLRGAYISIHVNSSDYVIIENNSIGTNAAKNGIRVSASDQNNYGIIRNNIIDANFTLYYGYEYGSPYIGIQLADAQNWSIYNNYIKNWIHTGIGLYNVNYLIPTINNKFYNNTITAPDISYGRAFEINCLNDELGSCSYNKFYNNYVVNTTVRTQISGDHNEIYNNIFDTVNEVSWHDREQALSLTPLEGISKNNTIYNNVFYNAYRAGFRTGAASEIEPNLVEGNKFINNIILNSEDFAIDIVNSDVIGVNTFKNNIIYKSDVDDVILYKDLIINITEFNSLNSELVENNIYADPMFVDSEKW